MSAEVTHFPPPWTVDEAGPALDPAVLHRPGRQRAGARLRLFRGGAGQARGGSPAHPRNEARRIAANITQTFLAPNL